METWSQIFFVHSPANIPRLITLLTRHVYLVTLLTICRTTSTLLRTHIALRKEVLPRHDINVLKTTTCFGLAFVPFHCWLESVPHKTPGAFAPLFHAMLKEMILALYLSV